MYGCNKYWTKDSDGDERWSWSGLTEVETINNKHSLDMPAHGLDRQARMEDDGVEASDARQLRQARDF
jgi:hypothetical protein